MTIFIKKYQSQSKDERKNGKWYARPKYIGTVDERDLAKKIEKESTVAEADVLAVLSALVSVMDSELKDSKRVRLTGLGTFKMGISTKPADEEDKFTVRNITKSRVLFTPDGVKSGSTGAVTRAMTTGVSFAEWGGDGSKKEDTSSGSGSGSGSSSSGGDNANA